MEEFKNSYSIDAVILDLDGVITDTATLHFKSWKYVFDEYLRLKATGKGGAFREFTIQDYLRYVDGKPRYKGVESFLKSRSIELPFGHPTDSPDKETICGIGNKKNERFRQILTEEKVGVFRGSIDFISQLREKGIKIGVASSSKNCKHILKSAGIEDLFDTIVDGEVSARLELKGKPQADIFVTAARNLGSVPAKSIVIEDAISGVEAGRNGGFGLVIGIARKKNESELFEYGADMVVTDLSQLSLEMIERWFTKTPSSLFRFWDDPPKLTDMFGSSLNGQDTSIINPSYFYSGRNHLFGGRRFVLFLDYDGTLTPIVERPELAILSEETKRVVEQLSRKHTVAIISGRARSDVENLVGIKGIFYAGSHGFDISGPGFSMIQPQAQEAIPVVDRIAKELLRQLSSIEGILIEEKKFSVAVHWRLVNERFLPQIKVVVNRMVKESPGMRLMEGKKVFEILPNIDWDKGKALIWIMQALNISWQNTCVLYLGDDTTDEDAFRVVRTRGLGILVSERPRVSCADFFVKSPQEVRILFDRIINLS
jgi:alpha,alpha-trehalase